jgi:hypothetical protein
VLLQTAAVEEAPIRRRVVDGERADAVGREGHVPRRDAFVEEEDAALRIAAHCDRFARGHLKRLRLAAAWQPELKRHHFLDGAKFKLVAKSFV